MEPVYLASEGSNSYTQFSQPRLWRTYFTPEVHVQRNFMLWRGESALLGAESNRGIQLTWTVGSVLEFLQDHFLQWFTQTGTWKHGILVLSFPKHPSKGNVSGSNCSPCSLRREREAASRCHTPCVPVIASLGLLEADNVWTLCAL